MSVLASRHIVERRVDGWSFHIDASRVPSYVIVTAVGAPNPNVFLQSVSDVFKVMDEFVGPGARFCPVVFNASQARPGGLTVPTVMRAFPGVIRRLGKVYVVTNREHEGSDFMLNFIKGMMSLHGGIRIVHSLEQALEALEAQ